MPSAMPRRRSLAAKHTQLSLARQSGSIHLMSLFGSDSDSDTDHAPLVTHHSAVPSIPGLYIIRSAIPPTLQHSLALHMSTTALSFTNNQVMLFESPAATTPFAPFLAQLYALLPTILTPHLPPSLAHHIIYSTQPRNAILNVYAPGRGISPHLDLPHKYHSGIVGISLLAPIVMEFTKQGAQPQSVWLKPGDVYVLAGEARDEWLHGITYRDADWIERDGGELVKLNRRIRMSITLRRMLPGADLVGP